MSFFERYKKLILVLGFVAVVIGLGYLIYFTFFKSTVATTPQEVAQEQGAGLPQANTGAGGHIVTPGQEQSLTGETSSQGAKTTATGQNQTDEVAKGGFTKVDTINQSPSYGITMAPNSNDVRFYNGADGKFYTIDANGKSVAMSDKAFYQVQNVTWSPANNKAILTYPDGSKIIYDFDQKKQISLPEHWQGFSFSPDGSEIVLKSVANDVNNRWLAVTSSDGSKTYPVQQIGDEATVIPSWSPNKQSIAMYTEAQGLNNQNVYFVGLHGENFKAANIDGRDFRPTWSPKGDNLVYSVYSDASNLKPTLYAVDAQGDHIGENRRKLDLDTWANKCTFADNNTMYCAVPKTLDRGAGLFPKMAENTADDIYRVDIQTNTKTKIATPDQDLTVAEITISPDQSNLFFNDSKTGQLHKIKLK